MEIDKSNILTTITKMMMAGKALPQSNLFRYAEDPAKEQTKVITDTVNLWWDVFSKHHVGVEAWEAATDRALVISGVPRLDTATINPALMQEALNQCAKERLEMQLAKHEQEKREEKQHGAYPFPEMGRLVAYHMGYHCDPEIPLPEPETVRAWAFHAGWHEEDIDANMIKLRIYYNFGQYARRDGGVMPVKLVVNANKTVAVELIG